MPIYSTPLDFDCDYLSILQGQVCLPLIDNCDIIGDNPDEWVNYPGNEWNLNLCQTDVCYFVPFVEGDIVQIQTKFLDPGRDTPTPYASFITINITDESGNSLAGVPSRVMSAWDEKRRRNYQIAEFEFTSMPDCFKIEFTSGDLTIVTNSFKKLPNCQRTFTIQSTYANYDCFGYKYDAPDEYEGDLIEYNNIMRYYGEIKMDGNAISKNRLGSAVTTGTVTTNWKIILAKMIPPFVKSIMVEQHLAGQKVYVNGKEYLFDDVSIEPEDTKNNMFFFTVRPQKQCNVNYRC